MDKIIVNLVQKEEKHFLEFNIPEHTLSIDLNSEEQDSLRVLFNRILNIVVNKNIILELVINEDYNNILFKEIANEYIDSLNTELGLIRENWIDKFVTIENVSE